MRKGEMGSDLTLELDSVCTEGRQSKGNLCPSSERSKIPKTSKIAV